MNGKDLDKLCINTIRTLSLDMVERANSGHPGLPLGAASVAYVLWTRFLKFNPKSPLWPDRDRFILSAGHGSALLYSMLHLAGYEMMSVEELKNFRQWGSRTPGHPEAEPDAGVEVTTGPLGQGVANAVGMAIAERHLAAQFNRPDFEIVNHYTFALCSDGDLMEGVASEASSLAGHLKLGKLILVYDDNGITLSGATGLTFTEDVGMRFTAYGWHVQRVDDGNVTDAVEGAINKAREEGSRPSLVIIKTHIGYGSPHKQDTFEAHGSPLGPDEAKATKKNLGWTPEAAFLVPEEVRERFGKVAARGAGYESEWDALMASYAETFPELMDEWKDAMGTGLPDGWEGMVPEFAADDKGMATRVAGGKVMNAIASRISSLAGGSADLDPSTKTALKGMGSFQPPGNGDDTVQGSEKGAWDYASPNLAFGVREHAMGGVMNGMAAHGGVIPFGSTFLIFSDYMRPAIRLAALSGLHVVYVFTHDSVALGEDGPTHQPVEHISSLRAIPGLTVIRPSDANETAEAWKIALARRKGPVALILSRQDLPVLDRDKFAPASGLHRGAYIMLDPPDGDPDVIIIATGSEVHPALKAAEILSGDGVNVRVVSMPSCELFEEQTGKYKDSVLPPGITRRLSVEAASPHGWHRYVGLSGAVIGIDRFGASAPGEVNMQKFGFAAENIVLRAKALINERISWGQ